MQLASTVNHYEQFRSLLQSHIAKLKSLQFSERFFHLCSNAAALVPAAETLQFYEEIKQRMSVSISPTEPNDHIFIDGGISHINKIIASKKPYTYLTPYSVFFLRKNAANLSVQMPEWLPEVYKTDSLDGNHSYTYLFNWSTVRVEHLCSRYIGMLVDAAYNEALGRPSDKKAELVVAVNNFADLGKLNVQPTAEREKPELKTTLQAPATSIKNAPAANDKPASSSSEPMDAVQRSLYIAKKYLKMQSGAVERGLSFTLTLDDMANLLRSKRCHYTGRDLVSFEHSALDKADLPDNYLTIDRVDNNIGYEIGNVVVCAKSINQLKDQMSKEEFDQAIAIQKMLKTSGVSLSPQQLAIMSASL